MFLRKRFQALSYGGQLNLLLLPYVVGTVVLILMPAFLTLLVAFTDYDAIGFPNWVGLENFRGLFASPLFRDSLKHTLIFTSMSVPLRVIVAFGLALLLFQSRRFFGVYRAAVYVPTLIPEAAYALIWLWILNPLYGPLNFVLVWLGLPAPAWLVEEESARLALVIMTVFQIGEGFIIMLAALQNVPQHLYEAASVDGANWWQKFWRITMPLVVPWLLLVLFRELILSFQSSFTATYMLTYGGPYYATTFAPLLIYELSFDYFEFGLSAAMLSLMYLITGILILGVMGIVMVQEENQIGT